MKRMKALFLAVCMLLSVMLLAACNADKGNETTPTDAATDAAYKVTVVDGSGNPCTDGVIVKFMKGTEQAAMQKVNESGVAEKTMPKADYTVQLQFTGDASMYHYETEGLTLSAEKTELTITLYNTASTEKQNLFAQGKDYDAYTVSTGSTYVNLTAGDRSYFLFTPTQAGTYQFSVAGEGLQLGYYGAPHYVQDHNAAEDLENNTFTQSITEGMIGTSGGTTILVLGIDSESATNCVLSIERIGDPAWSIESEPWTEYVCKHEVKPFTLDISDGQKLTYVDIKGKTSDYNVVYNEADGYYHMGSENGPVVYINLGKDAPNQSLQVVIQGDGAAGGAPIRRYFFNDENAPKDKENFVKKEDYTDILVKYFENMDQTYNVYPLTEDLVYIIENGCFGWWTSGNPNYKFEGCNPELGWLFACCYIEG